jgi:hypothetical protein
MSALNASLKRSVYRHLRQHIANAKSGKEFKKTTNKKLLNTSYEAHADNLTTRTAERITTTIAVFLRLLGKYVRNMTIRHNFKCTSSQSIFIT